MHNMLIFISHSSKDKEVARKIKRELELLGLQVWLDEANIRVGQSIPNEIAEAINECSVFCLLISQTSKDSSWVKRELNSFMSYLISGKADIVPCRLEDVEMPIFINDVKYADFSNSFNEGMGQLIDAVRIREEIQLQSELQDSRQKLLSTLSPPDIAWFIHYFSIHNFYFIGDTRDAKWPTALHKLVEVGALDLITDSHERDYSLTDKGRLLLILMESDAPQELLDKWDREIGPRKKVVIK
jgi:hypothetical protein